MTPEGQLPLRHCDDSGLSGSIWQHLLGEFWQLPEEVQVPEENLQDLILPSWTPGHTATAMVSLRASFAT